tara:strand:- start:7804 stop:8106 length:303 start_codon:yes stop_codon:yes gene_type:complete
MIQRITMPDNKEKLLTYKGDIEFCIDVNNLNSDFMDAHSIEVDDLGVYIYKEKRYNADTIVDVINECIVNECTSWLSELDIGVELGLSTVVIDGVESWTR